MTQPDPVDAAQPPPSDATQPDPVDAAVPDRTPDIRSGTAPTARSGAATDNRRRARHPRNRREEIIRIALDLFAERGYRGTALAAVAERAGLTQQGLLHYFPGKQALLLEALQVAGDMDIRRMFVGAGDAAVPLDHLTELVAHDTTRPAALRAFTVLAAESVTDDHPAHTFFAQRYTELRQGAARSLRTQLGGRSSEDLTVEQASALLVAVLDGLRLQWLLQPDEIDMPAVFTAFLALLRRPPELPPHDR
ncbi:TetR/AcrR family transcriptional regulator [Planosporangium sp. 12N6]|uniref:TetR/AcrR family transcriptional regulator n=1 Tax=Planosporangium spinosum TaxID=3402278 RepID=UPI003CF2EEA5